MSMRFLRNLLMYVVAGLLGMAWVAQADESTASIQHREPFDGSTLRSGTLLIASEQMQGVLFGHSVVLITAHSEDGTVGLMLNKPLSIGTLPEFDLSRGDPPLFFGGPVGPHLLFALVRPDGNHHLQSEISSNVYIVMGLDEILEAAHEFTPSTQVHLYAGYAGWAPGQLESEIADGDWIAAPLEDGTVFDLPSEDLWPVLRKRWKGHWAFDITRYYKLAWSHFALPAPRIDRYHARGLPLQSQNIPESFWFNPSATDKIP